MRATKKILLIENNLDYLKTLTDLLQAHGFHPTGAKSAEEARNKLKTYWFHLVICDVRLENDLNPKDDSGLRLLKEDLLKETPKIVVTSYATQEIAQQVVGLALAFFDKDDNPRQLIHKVEEIFAEKVHLNWDLQMHYHSDFPLSFYRMAELLSPEKYPDQQVAEELYDLFLGLFPEANDLYLNRAIWQVRDRIAIIVNIYYENNQRFRSRMVTCGLKEVLLEERQNFKVNVPSGTGFNTNAGREHFETAHFAANTYQLNDSDLSRLYPLQRRARVSSPDWIEAILDNLFFRTIGPWHKAAESQKKMDHLVPWFHDRAKGIGDYSLLFEERLENLWGLLPYSLRPGLSETEIRFTIPSKTVVLPNPVMFLKRILDNAFDDRVRFINTSGHLYGDNILTDGKNTWLTDFKDAGPAPVFRDYLSLESAFRFDWTSHEDFESIYDREHELIFGNFIDLQFKNQNQDEDAQRSLSAITCIRKFMLKKTELTEAYYLGLFFHAMMRVLQADEKKALLKGERDRLFQCILTCAMIAKHLATKKSKPVQLDKKIDHRAQKPRPKIHFDRKKKTISIDGVEKRIRGSKRFKIFCHLYDHAGSPCSREVLGPLIYPNYDGKKDMINLNTIIFRLRELIEEDPKNPEIITTIENGYQFDF